MPYYHSYSEPVVKVTWQEVFISFLIVGILTFIGIQISSAIKSSVDEKNLKYRQALQIVDNGEQLALACNTDIGNAFVEGDFHTLDPVSWDGLDGEYLKITRVEEEYRRHTRRVRHTDSKGHSYYTTHVYWTWDSIGRQSRRATRVEFCGNKYGQYVFNFGIVPSIRTVKDKGRNRRDVFYSLPKDFRGTIFADLSKKQINGQPIVYYGSDIQEVYESMISSHANVIFWVFWIFIMIISVVAFVILENRWLNS